eukprot:1895810-Prymnesium_polylepis.1
MQSEDGESARGRKWPVSQMVQLSPLPTAPFALLVDAAQGSHGSDSATWKRPATQPQLPPAVGTRSLGHTALPLSQMTVALPRCSATVNTP